MLDRDSISDLAAEWMAFWNRHNLEGVLGFMADDVVFEHWNGRIVRGTAALRRVWQPWFANHGEFHFKVKGVYVDERQQAFSLDWQLQWPSVETPYLGQRELREGVDLVTLCDGRIVSKRTFIKTALILDQRTIVMKA